MATKKKTVLKEEELEYSGNRFVVEQYRKGVYCKKICESLTKDAAEKIVRSLNKDAKVI